MLEGIIQMARAQPGDGADAVHPGGRHGARDRGRRGGPAECGGAGRARVHADRCGRRAVRLWRLHLQRGHEVRRAGLRHARIHEGLRCSAASLPGATGCPTAPPTPTRPTPLDAQAAYESVFSLWGAVMGGVNLLMHGAGWMEGGLHASFEKMVLDADLLDMVAEFLRPVVVNDEELALDAMREVGPGGHFFGCAHTQARYRNAFFAPDDLGLAQLRELAGGGHRRRPTILRTVSTSSGSPPSSSRRWIRPFARNSKPSSPAARPRAACPPITDEDQRTLP